MSQVDYSKKYMKYKIKFLKLKNQVGGTIVPLVDDFDNMTLVSNKLLEDINIHPTIQVMYKRTFGDSDMYVITKGPKYDEVATFKSNHKTYNVNSLIKGGLVQVEEMKGGVSKKVSSVPDDLFKSKHINSV